MSYTHLTPSERNQLYKMRVIDQLSISLIAQEMNRSPATISREIKRNLSDDHLYLPDKAQKMADDRRQESKELFGSISEIAIDKIKYYLELSNSPRQTSGRMKNEDSINISHETIYQLIYANHCGLGDYKKHLRQKQKKRRRRKGVNQKRGTIPNRVGIENRPPIADLKTQIGHWEGDTVIGSNHNGAIVTYVDKASKYLVAGLINNKKANQVNVRTIELFQEVKPEFRRTITLDNGTEFSKHEELAKELELDIFFANPHSPWERGLNEHTNGLIREFLPKGTNFRVVTDEALKKIVDLINNRARESLDYRTPYEVFYNCIRIQM
jgi:transposase, IS30 family